MTRLQFRLTLLSDVILNVKSASEGSNNTLDFIPGNNFLGMVASALYPKCTKEEALDLFHNGCVRYGDAHLAIKGMRTVKKGMRTVKVPAAMYYEKGKSVAEATYIYNVYNREADTDKMQLKQCRSGFYAFTTDENGENKGLGIKAKTSFAIKSAYDRDNRRSKDNQMFGYESLTSGQQFYFSVETDKDGYTERIKEALCGIKHLGRSRTAQYGLVEIKACSYKEIKSDFSKKDEITEITVYADGRLIFLDDNGEPTFKPTPKDLGIEGGKILWEKSQIRTFQYAPWNAKRHAYDTDRCGIEKGSVFVVEGGTITDKSGLVGSYRNEGFGTVIYNPCFLSVEENSNGKSLYKLEEYEPKKADDSNDKPQWNPEQPKGEQQKADCDTHKEETFLLQYLNNRAKEQECMNEIYARVNAFVDSHGDKFTSESFASQWGTIRSIVMAASTKEDIMNRLFYKKRKDSKGKDVDGAYLTHGVAKEKWAGERKKVFHEFCKSVIDSIQTIQECQSADKESADKACENIYFKQALINLASQMEKRVSQMAKLKGKEGKQ